MSLSDSDVSKVLLATLANDTATIRAAEGHLANLQPVEGYPLLLAQLAYEPGAQNLRRTAALNLKRFIETHWHEHQKNFVSEAHESDKVALRAALPRFLGEPDVVLRNAMGTAIAAIATYDIPELWPDLVDLLLNNLQSTDHTLVHGSIKCLSHVISDVTDEYLEEILPRLAPLLYAIFISENYIERLRMRAVSTFCSVLQHLHQLLQVHPAVAKTILNPILAAGWMEAFVQWLNTPDDPNQDCGLKIEIIRTLNFLAADLPGAFKPFVESFVSAVWAQLNNATQTYQAAVIEVELETVAAQDSDGKALGYEFYTATLVEFLLSLVQQPKFSKIVKHGIEPLCDLAVVFMQLTGAQEQHYLDDPEAFIEDDDEEAMTFNTRIGCVTLFEEFAGTYGDRAVHCICAVVMRRLNEANEMRAQGHPFWWKRRESALHTLGIVAEQLLQSEAMTFDANAFFTEIVAQDLAPSYSGFLRGRVLVTGSRFVAKFTPELQNTFLKASLENLTPNNDLCTRLLACKAIEKLCEELPEPMLAAAGVDLMKNLCLMITECTEEPLVVVLGTLLILMKRLPSLVVEYEPQLTPGLLSLICQPGLNPMVLVDCVAVISHMAMVPGAAEGLSLRVMPAIEQCFLNFDDSGDDHSKTLAENLTELLTDVVSSSPCLSPLLMDVGFVSLMHMLLNSEDHGVLQAGGETLRAYVRIGTEAELLQWEHNGRTAISLILEFLGKVLDPSRADSACLFIGPLVSKIFVKFAGSLGDINQQLLQVCFTRLQTAASHTVIQTLCLVFAQLINNAPDPSLVLDFLAQQDSANGLAWFMNTWTGVAPDFLGEFHIKISTIALSKLFMCGDPRLADVVVEIPEAIQSSFEGILTRSKAKKTQTSLEQINLLQRIFNILIHFLESTETEFVLRGNQDDEADDEDDEDEADDGEPDADAEVGKTHWDIDAIIESKFWTELDDDDEEDPDDIADPLYEVKLRIYLTEFLDAMIQSNQALFNQYFAGLPPSSAKWLEAKYASADPAAA